MSKVNPGIFPHMVLKSALKHKQFNAFLISQTHSQKHCTEYNLHKCILYSQDILICHRDLITMLLQKVDIIISITNFYYSVLDSKPLQNSKHLLRYSNIFLTENFKNDLVSID